MNNTLRIDDLTLKIISLLSKDPFNIFTVNKVKRSIKGTNYATVYRKIDRLVELKILSKTMYGMSSQLRLNLQNEETLSILSLIEIRKFESFKKGIKGILSTILNQIIKETKELLEFKCVLIFGSYAKGKQTPKSDLDILVIFELSSKIAKENREDYIKEVKKSMQGIIRTSAFRGGPDIIPIIISSDEHKEMILDKEQNVAKETLLNHVILKGFDDYWREISKCFLEKS